MDHGPGGVAQRGFDSGGLQAADQPGVLIGIADQAARDLLTGLVTDHHGVAFVEGSLNAAYAGGQQAFAAPHGGGGAGVHAQDPGGRQRSGDPGLVGGGRCGGRFDDRRGGPRLKRRQGRGPRAQRDNRGAARRRGDPGGGQFGGHAAGAHAGGQIGPAGHGLQLRGQPGDTGDQGRGCIAAGIGRIEPLHVGQQHQSPGANQLGHARREAIVVADPDLLGDHGVVLVDHRDDAQAQQRLDGGACVQPAAAHLGVVAGQQDLGAGQSVRLKRRLPRPHQRRLAGGGGGLFLRQAETLAQAQAATAQGHGAGRHHQHLLAAGSQARHVGGEIGEPLSVRRAVRADQQGGADLDDDALGRRQFVHGAQSSGFAPSAATSSLRWRTSA